MLGFLAILLIIILLALMMLVQLYLSSREGKAWGLILPAIFAVMLIYAIFHRVMPVDFIPNRTAVGFFVPIDIIGCVLSLLTYLYGRYLRRAWLLRRDEQRLARKISRRRKLLAEYIGSGENNSVVRAAMEEEIAHLEREHTRAAELFAKDGRFLPSAIIGKKRKSIPVKEATKEALSAITGKLRLPDIIGKKNADSAPAENERRIITPEITTCDIDEAEPAPEYSLPEPELFDEPDEEAVLYDEEPELEAAIEDDFDADDDEDYFDGEIAVDENTTDVAEAAEPPADKDRPEPEAGEVSEGSAPAAEKKPRRSAGDFLAAGKQQLAARLARKEAREKAEQEAALAAQREAEAKAKAAEKKKAAKNALPKNLSKAKRKHHHR